MSPFWSEPRRVWIGPDACVVGRGDAVRRMNHDGSAQAILQVLGDVTDLAGRGRWDVILADELLRYLVIRWPAGLRGRAEREAFLAHRFRAVHEIDAREWQIEVEHSIVAQTPVLACAMPRSVIGAVVDWSRGRRKSITRITGDFIATYNRLRSHLDAPHGALALQDRGRLSLARWSAGHWETMRCQPIGDNIAVQLGLMLNAPLDGAARGASDSAPTGGVVYTVGSPLPVPAGWRCVVLEGA